MDKRYTKLRESEVERQAGNIRFADVIKPLRFQGAALESSRAEVAALQSKYSQATSVAVALQERIEAQVTSTQHHRAMRVIDANHILRTTESSTHASSQVVADPFTCQTVLPRQISSAADQESDVTKRSAGCASGVDPPDVARRALEDKFVEAVENLRLRSAELQASMVEVEASQFKCSQYMFLSAALQERVDDLL